MPRNPNQAQFDEYRDWQWVKHLVLRRYATPWSVILGSIARELFVVDTCAGAGAYTDPDTGETIAEGSPIIFARRAKEYTEQRGPGKSMRVICAERDSENHALLVDRLRPYAPHAFALSRGPFHRHVPEIIKMLGDAPALVLLDPIGLKAIRADTWRPLLERAGKTDLFIVLMFSGLHRIGGMLNPDGTARQSIVTARRSALEMDAVFRTDAWRAIAIDPELAGEQYREARERRYVELFCDHVIGDRHRWKCPVDVRASLKAPLKYWLVHASDDLKPYMLMNDQIVELREILFAHAYSGSGQIEGFLEAQIEAERNAVRRKLEAAIFDCLKRAQGRVLPFGAIRDQLVDSFFGRVKQGAYWNVVKALVKEGRLEREKRPAAACDISEMISLPASPEDRGEGARVIPIRPAA